MKHRKTDTTSITQCESTNKSEDTSYTFVTLTVQLHCAHTRHAFVGVYDSHLTGTVPISDLVGNLARRGDPALAMRYWVAAVQAETFAGLGDLDRCQRALDTAEQVPELTGNVHNGSWLRFDRSRLAERIEVQLAAHEAG